MVTSEPLSFDGTAATIGCPGSAAIRGSGLPGTTCPGRLGFGLAGAHPGREPPADPWPWGGRSG
ncbi:hypothetical protein [Micromonospora sp. M71_S20]|uniref:hypothetical protein n=1 Tax=Micromonospora sp. M71_S20 TaxID=592872 RepID=UPI000EAE4FC4|nr:hypothetical protein [Micromonospora sp. M71_S20]